MAAKFHPMTCAWCASSCISTINSHSIMSSSEPVAYFLSSMRPQHDRSAGSGQVYYELTFFTIPCPVVSGLVVMSNLQSLLVNNILPKSPNLLLFASGFHLGLWALILPTSNVPPLCQMILWQFTFHTCLSSVRTAL